MAAMETIEDLDNPLGSCILVPGTYRILSLPLEIEGHVVMPAGVRLIAPADPNLSVIEVMPGGLLETGGAAFYTDEEYPTVLPPVEILPEDPNLYFAHNNVGILVHRGADPKTRLENLEISGCRIGIVIDEQLEYPINRIITFGCYDGIYLYAPAEIVDCQFLQNGSIYYGIFGYVGTGIYVWLDWESDPQPEVSIQRTILYGADVGLYIEGGNTDPNVSEPNQVVPSVNVVNSCFASGYFYGLYQSSGDALIDVQYSAFGDNDEHTNLDLPYTGCIVLPYDPFYTLNNGNKLYIDPWSPMTDAGYGMAEDGMGTAHDGPDTGQMDIGSHFPIGVTGSFGFPSSPADFNWDGVVDELDLELMNACMGAMNDPNIVRFDLDYGSRVDMPDFAWFSYDYGYSADPNESGNNDPNCARSDFDGDDRVDIADLALLVEHWLRPVFDEYRICRLCNLHTAIDPNDPNAPSGSTMIDLRDYDALMADWGMQSSFDPNIVIEQSASMLSVAVENPVPAWKMSVFLDNDLIGQWETGGLGSTDFDVDLTRYGPGSHRVKVVRNIGNGMEITEQVITDPNSTGLYFANVPDTFEPNEPYFVRGFNLGDELNFKIKDIYDMPIYDVNVPAGAVTLEIPSETFDEALMTTFSASSAIAPADEKRYEKLLKQKFDRDKYQSKVIRFLVLLPDKKVSKVFRKAIFTTLDAIHKRGPADATIILKNTDVNYDNLKFAIYNTYGSKIVVFFGHANSHVGATWRDGQNVGGVQRTWLQCYQKREGYVWDSYDNVGMVSHTRNTKQDADLLPDGFDNVVIDLTRLLRGRTSQTFVPIQQMYVFGCLSAKAQDMAVAQGCFGDHDNAAHDMLYVGFTKKVLAGDGSFFGFGDELSEGIALFFQRLGNGYTVGETVQYLQSASIPTEIRYALWGDGWKDIDYNGDDTVRFYGLGYGNVKFGPYEVP
jgi:hypothetical protein